MKFGKSLWLVMLLVTAVVVAACGGNGDDDTESSDNGAGDGAAVQNTDVNLSQTISGDTPQGTVTVAYPEGWAAEVSEFGEITFAESEATLTLANDSEAVPTEGQILGSVIQVVDAEGLGFIGLDDTATVVDVATSLIEVVSPDGAEDVPQFSDPADFTANGRNGVTVTGTLTEEEATVETVIVVIEEGDAMIVLVFGGAEGATEQYNAEIEAIAGALEFEPAAASEEG